MCLMLNLFEFLLSHHLLFSHTLSLVIRCPYRDDSYECNKCKDFALYLERDCVSYQLAPFKCTVFLVCFSFSYTKITGNV